jgi:hypothetical protein
MKKYTSEQAMTRLRYRAGVRTKHSISKEAADAIDRDFDPIIQAIASGKKLKRSNRSVAASQR